MSDHKTPEEFIGTVVRVLENLSHLVNRLNFTTSDKIGLLQATKEDLKTLIHDIDMCILYDTTRGIKNLTDTFPPRGAGAGAGGCHTELDEQSTELFFKGLSATITSMSTCLLNGVEIIKQKPGMLEVIQGDIEGWLEIVNTALNGRSAKPPFTAVLDVLWGAGIIKSDDVRERFLVNSSTIERETIDIINFIDSKDEFNLLDAAKVQDFITTLANLCGVSFQDARDIADYLTLAYVVYLKGGD